MKKGTYVVAINAISGGGKTAVTKELQKQLPNTQALYFDDWDFDSDSGIDDICKWVEDGADVNEFNLERFEKELSLLLENAPDFLLLDYPFGRRQKRIGAYVDLSVFIDTPLDVALARRIIRDYDDATVSNVTDDMKRYLSRGRDAYLYGMDAGKADADLIVDGNKSIREIVSAIKRKIAFDIQS